MAACIHIAKIKVSLCVNVISSIPVSEYWSSSRRAQEGSAAATEGTPARENEGDLPCLTFVKILES